MNPDFVDLTHEWFNTRYPALGCQISEGRGITDGKILIIQTKPGTIVGTWLFSLSVGGSLWHHALPEDPHDLHLKINPADPKCFERLEWVVNRRIHEHR
jgi:hypothetical protein